jgi:hypothetical protein
MKVHGRLRFHMATAMVMIAVIAVVLGWAAAERRKRVAELAAESQRQEEHVRWAQRLQKLEYLSKASVLAEEKRQADVEHQLERLGATRKAP